VFILDLAAKVDQCAEYICKQQWGDLEFPPPFGREAFPEVMSAVLQGRSVVAHLTVFAYFIRLSCLMDVLPSVSRISL